MESNKLNIIIIYNIYYYVDEKSSYKLKDESDVV